MVQLVVVMQLTKAFCVYFDWTLEDQPRVFYVGKGNQNRINDNKRRNRYYKNIAKKYGVRREIALEFDDEDEALDSEIRLIQERKTYVYGGEGFWGANMTLGGEGRSGSFPDDETRQRMSASQLIAWQADGRHEQASVVQHQRWADEELRHETSIKYTKVWADPALRQTMSDTLKSVNARPEVKQKRSEIMTNYWQSFKASSWIKIVCQRCERTFDERPSRAGRKFCSNRCKYNHN